MRKLRLEIDALRVETFEPAARRDGRGTVRGYLSAYYELCHMDDTWQQTCTCEPTCNADTCFNCTGNCQSGNCPSPGCSGTCTEFVNYTVDPTSCQATCQTCRPEDC